MITKAESDPSNGIASVLDSMASKVEEVTDYFADAVLGSDAEEENNIPDDEREPDDCSVDSDGSFSFASCGSVSCGSVDDGSVETLTLTDQRDYAGKKKENTTDHSKADDDTTTAECIAPIDDDEERHTTELVKVEEEIITTDKPKASITLIPFVIDQPGLLGIQVNGVTSNNFAYVAGIPSTSNAASKKLQPGDVLAPYQPGSIKRPTPYTLAEFTCHVISSERPLRFVAIRSSKI